MENLFAQLQILFLGDVLCIYKYAIECAGHSNHTGIEGGNGQKKRTHAHTHAQQTPSLHKISNIWRRKLITEHTM